MHTTQLRRLFLVTLAVSLGCIVALVHDEVLWLVVVLAAEVRLENALHTSCVARLGVERGTRHVRYGGVASAPWMLGVAKWVILWSWLWEPHITTVATKLSALQCLCYVLLHNDGATGGVDKPRT
jgi:hypothetical protein